MRASLDARGLLVLPGCVDVHTHTRLPSDEEPDRFFQDSVAAAFGGTTTFLAFNNPGTGISERGSASLLAGLRRVPGAHRRARRRSTSRCPRSSPASRRIRLRSCRS